MFSLPLESIICPEEVENKGKTYEKVYVLNGLLSSLYSSWNASHWTHKPLQLTCHQVMNHQAHSVSWIDPIALLKLCFDERWKNRDEQTRVERKARLNGAKDVVRLNIKLYAFRSLLRSHVSKFYKFSPMFVCVSVFWGVRWWMLQTEEMMTRWMMSLLCADDLWSSRECLHLIFLLLLLADKKHGLEWFKRLWSFCEIEFNFSELKIFLWTFTTINYVWIFNCNFLNAHS